MLYTCFVLCEQLNILVFRCHSKKPMHGFLGSLMNAGKLLKKCTGFASQKVEGLHECMSVVPRIQAHDLNHANVSIMQHLCLAI